jgi:hypothetical protein
MSSLLQAAIMRTTAAMLNNLNVFIVIISFKGFNMFTATAASLTIHTNQLIPFRQSARLIHRAGRRR